MARYWSDQALRYIECESICFTGPQATHTLLPRLAYDQREKPLQHYGFRHGELPSMREMIGKGESAGAHWRGVKTTKASLSRVDSPS